MPFPTLAKIAATLSEADIQRLLVLKRSGPRLEKLEAKRKKIADLLAAVEKELAALAGNSTPKTAARRGRKPGRPAKATAAPAKRGRPVGSGRKPDAVKTPAAKQEGPFTYISSPPRSPRKRRSAKQPPKMTRAIQREFQEIEDGIRQQVIAEHDAAKRATAVRNRQVPESKSSAANDARRAKLLENLAKARAARAAKRAAAQ